MTAMTATLPPTPAAADDRRWQAMLDRDTAFDGAFVCAVRSTKIYCRPSCPARTPKREHVTFFPTPERAREAGYRACRRCHPDALTAAEVALARQVGGLIDAARPDVPSLEQLSRACGVSPFHLQRTFKRVLGVTPRQYAASRRADELRARLRGEGNVTSALYEAGFGSSSRLYESAPDLLGMTPAVYQRGGLGMRIAYATAACSLGTVLVGATERGIACVTIGDAAAPLEALLRAEFPAAEIHRDDGATKPWVEAVVDRIDGDGRGDALPVDVQSTVFRMRVWEALRAIPRGETRTYREIAEAIGAPNAHRAVANACGANPVAVVIPCHRVFRSDGGDGGYRWGVARKRALLARERAPRPR
jgi:AraC family transcriptional regulator of adaptative response/methylated-DNA-[protein]-cysteine methyltransferase